MKEANKTKRGGISLWSGDDEERVGQALAKTAAVCHLMALFSVAGASWFQELSRPTRVYVCGGRTQ